MSSFEKTVVDKPQEGLASIADKVIVVDVMYSSVDHQQ